MTKPSIIQLKKHLNAYLEKLNNIKQLASQIEFRERKDGKFYAKLEDNFHFKGFAVERSHVSNSFVEVRYLDLDFYPTANKFRVIFNEYNEDESKVLFGKRKKVAINGSYYVDVRKGIKFNTKDQIIDYARFHLKTDLLKVINKNIARLKKELASVDTVAVNGAVTKSLALMDELKFLKKMPVIRNWLDKQFSDRFFNLRKKD